MAVALASLSAFDVAAQAPKLVPKKPIKAPKLDLSQATLLKAGAGQVDAAQAAVFGPGKAIDGSPRIDRPNVLPTLADVERTAVRERLAALLGVEVAAVPVFKLTTHLNAPGDTVVLALNSPPGNGVYINAFDARQVFRTNNGPGFVRLVGDDAVAGRFPSVTFNTSAEGERVYLYTCFVETDLPTLKVSLWEYGSQGGGAYFTLPVQNGKLFVPFETALGTYNLMLSLSLDPATAAGKVAEVSHCEMTRVR